MKKILVIDDEQDICSLLERFLKKKGFDCKAVTDEVYGFNLIAKNNYDLVITDLRMPSINGIDLLQKIKQLNAATKVIIITGYSDIKTAVQAMKYGAFDYVSKPLYPDEILQTINKALDDENAGAVALENQKDAAKVKTTTTSHSFVMGESKQAKKVLDNINLIAPTDMSVVILGETGTGKEYVAREIHNRSDRKDKAFFAVDCGALPDDLAGSELFGHVKGAFTGAITNKDGIFKAADGGTLFLDEIGNLSYDIQVKLLRVLQEKKYRKVGSNDDEECDVRIIAATNENLKEAVTKGDFRQDLFFRLNEFSIPLAPLRHRRDDIAIFSKHFLAQSAADLNKTVDDIEPKVFDVFNEYTWPGNLREMKNVIKRAVLVTTQNQITKACLPEELLYPSISSVLAQKDSLKDASAIAEKETIMRVLKETGNNKSKAAAILNIDRKTLYNKLKSYKNQENEL